MSIAPVPGWRRSSLLTASYVDTPVVLTSVDRSVGWAEREGPHRVVPLGSRPSDAELIEAIEVALGDEAWPSEVVVASLARARHAHL